ncbi:MAG: ADP-dependent glucokinase/phosphofructokinase [Bacteroidota bacterium]
MLYSELKKKWLNHYQTATDQLEKMTEVKGLISAFNANIDAVIKVSGNQIEQIIEKSSMNQQQLLIDGEKSIKTSEDALRGLIHCFKNGIAEEWLIDNKEVFDWLNENIGYDKMQMGGQGGIVANVMAVCGVDPVYVHTASSPKEQSKLFLDLPNLKNIDENGKIRKAHDISRSNDIPLIHWIIEFDKGDTININNETISCPKANRFIATYDPLNFELHIDEAFNKKMSGVSTEYEYIILSGYQMLHNQLPGGGSGIERIEESKKIIQQWRENNSQHILHFEIASTQDKTIRKHLIDNLANDVDSLGFNERELIDILEVIGEKELAEQCEENTNSSNLFKAMLKVSEYTSCPRIQLHMFGLYITLQKRGYKISAIQNRKGMQLAANIAASKAGTGSIDSKDVLLWSKDQMVSKIGLKELNSLAVTIEKEFGANRLLEEGIFTNDQIEVIAVPTIIIDNPVTLVGMGDTISSISLVAAR